ncbi:hypothetical protein MKY48_33010 [Paenibacillus sp. FSL W8-0187]|uniref:hypothetical protein n=1 Tax=Paenibacillus sp. FSL W8-0187 TaxID=2921710 RepID=UPI0030D76598
MSEHLSKMNVDDGIFEAMEEAGNKPYFSEPWTRSEYGLQEERLHDDYLRVALDIQSGDFEDFIRITSPEQAVDKLSELISMSLWSDSEWIPHEDDLRNRFEKFEFHFETQELYRYGFPL